jgi:hypothetical protein
MAVTAKKCERCGVGIQPATATRTGGLCVPCATGTREAIEKGRERNRRQKELRESPHRRYWSALVDRVERSAGRFDALTSAEQLYDAGCVLDSEVYNGGFEQFFDNSSGRLYSSALACLTALGAHQCLALLLQAKELLFPGRDVPVDTAARRAVLRTSSSPELARALDALDASYHADPDELGAKRDAFAAENRLFDGRLTTR